MTDNPGWASPSSSSDDVPDRAAPGGQEDAAPEGASAQDAAPGEAPPPNWAKQQPPRAEWTTPGSSFGGQAPGGPAGAGGQGGRGGYGGQGGGPTSGWGAGPGWGNQPPYSPAWGHPPAAKPGVIPLRPLGVGEILDGAVSTMRAHWRTVLGVSLVVALITQGITTVISWWMMRDVGAQLDALEADPNPAFGDLMNVFTGMFAGLGITQVITLLGTIFVTAMLTMVVSRAVLGRPVTTADAWRDAKPRLPRLLGLTLLLPLIALALLGVGSVPGWVALAAGVRGAAAVLFVIGTAGALGFVVWILVRYSLAAPALMLEKQGVFKSMVRSARLVRGAWWRVFGILLLTAVLTMIISSIVQTPFSVASLLLGDDSVGALFNGGSSGQIGIPALVVTGVGAAVGATIAFPISAGVTALLYVDQRIRREALDLELARAAGLPGYDGDADHPPADAATGGNIPPTSGN